MRRNGILSWLVILLASVTVPVIAVSYASGVPAFPAASLQKLLSRVGVIEHEGVVYKLEWGHVSSEGEWLIVRVKPKKV